MCHGQSWRGLGFTMFILTTALFRANRHLAHWRTRGGLPRTRPFARSTPRRDNAIRGFARLGASGAARERCLVTRCPTAIKGARWSGAFRAGARVSAIPSFVCNALIAHRCGVRRAISLCCSRRLVVSIWPRWRVGGVSSPSNTACPLSARSLSLPSDPHSRKMPAIVPPPDLRRSSWEHRQM
jgi:hypothetical protein